MNQETRRAFKLLNQRPIAYYPIYRVITGSTSAGVLLSQLMYWFSKMDDREFYKTDGEIMDETHLTEKELRNAKKTLKYSGFVRIYPKCVNGSPPKTHYFIDIDVLVSCVSKNKIAAGIEEMKDKEAEERRAKKSKTPIGRTSNKNDQRAKSKMTKGRKANSPKGENSIYTVDYNSRLQQETGDPVPFSESDLNDFDEQAERLKESDKFIQQQKELAKKEKSSAKKEKKSLREIEEVVLDFLRGEGMEEWKYAMGTFKGTLQQAETEVGMCLANMEKREQNYRLQKTYDMPITVISELRMWYGVQWVQERGKNSLNQNSTKNANSKTSRNAKTPIVNMETVVTALELLEREDELYGG